MVHDAACRAGVQQIRSVMWARACRASFDGITGGRLRSKPASLRQARSGRSRWVRQRPELLPHAPPIPWGAAVRLPVGLCTADAAGFSACFSGGINQLKSHDSFVFRLSLPLTYFLRLSVSSAVTVSLLCKAAAPGQLPFLACRWAAARPSGLARVMGRTCRLVRAESASVCEVLRRSRVSWQHCTFSQVPAQPSIVLIGFSMHFSR